MKVIWKKDKFFISFTLLTIILWISIFLPAHIPGNPSSYPLDGNNVILRYETFGCGSLVVAVQKGGEALYDAANLPYPDSGVYEVRLSKDSVQPRNLLTALDYREMSDPEKYSFYMSFEILGTSEGAPDCCDDKPAYNEVVPLVKVTKWEPTGFFPKEFNSLRQLLTMLALYPLVLLDLLLLAPFLHDQSNRVNKKILFPK